MLNKTNPNLVIYNLLLIRLSSIGDLLLTTPIIRAIRKGFPNCKIYFTTFSEFHQVLKNNPHIDNLIQIPKNKLKNDTFQFDILQNNKFDLIIDLQNNKYSKKIISHLNFDKIAILDKQRKHKLSTVYLKKPLIQNYSVVGNYFRTAQEFLPINEDEKGLEFWLDSETEYLSGKNKGKESNHIQIKTISVAPGAAHFTKQWLPEYFVELLQTINKNYPNKFTFNLLGSAKEKQICDFIELELAKGNCHVQNYAGKTSLEDTAQIINESDFMFTNDTSLMHIASARQVPMIVFFGSSSADLGFLSYHCDYRLLEIDLWCRPCSHIGRSFCPLGHFNCMKKITPQIAFLEFEKFAKEINLYS